MVPVMPPPTGVMGASRSRNCIPAADGRNAIRLASAGLVALRAAREMPPYRAESE
jgi:hypothetical protein